MAAKKDKSRTAVAKAKKPAKGQTPGKAHAKARKTAAVRAPNKKKPVRKAAAAPPPVEYLEPDPPEAIERLYFLRAGHYVQYNGQGPMPEELERHIAAHGGNYPSYIPLPMKAVEFCFGDWGERWGKARWDGHGLLPEKVLRYVEENGVLPRYETA